MTCLHRRDKYEPTKKQYFIEVTTDATFEKINEEGLEADFDAEFDESKLNTNAPDVVMPPSPSVSETELESCTPVKKKKTKRRRAKNATPSSSEPKPKGGKPLRKPSSAELETALQDPSLH